MIEPSTEAHPAEVDRTFTTRYDAGGLAVEERQPGDVVIDRSFDELGWMTAENGDGPRAPAASRTFAYDRSGLRTEASHPSGTITFSYDQRGLVSSVGGPAGSSTFAYDAAGRVTQRSDPAGTHDFTWTLRGELESVSDPVTDTTLTYSFDDASQFTGVDYGTGARTLTYDDLGRLGTDTLTDSSGTTTASHTYAYDADSHPVEVVVDLPGNSATGTHTYSYDRAGRLKSWTDDEGATTAYTYDGASNRTKAGTDDFSFDERNRLTTSPDGTHAYDRRGTLREVAGTQTLTYDYDALGRLVLLEGVTYTYDALDRVATRDAVSFTYAGASLDPASDGDFTYSRSPGGRLLGVTDGTDDALVGHNRHGDLSYLFGPDAGVSTTRTYDPYGVVLDDTGTLSPHLGYQGDYTDPGSSQVWMGARWYAPTWASFLSRDTVAGELTTPVSLNRYTYAAGNPLSYFDPDGRASCSLRDLSGCDGGSFGASPTRRAPSQGIGALGLTGGLDDVDEVGSGAGDQLDSGGSSNGSAGSKPSTPTRQPSAPKTPTSATGEQKSAAAALLGRTQRRHDSRLTLLTRRLRYRMALLDEEFEGGLGALATPRRVEIMVEAAIEFAREQGLDPAETGDLVALYAREQGEAGATARAVEIETTRSLVSLQDHGTRRVEGSSIVDEVFSTDSVATAGKAFSNFSASFADEFTQGLSFGLVDPGIDPFYEGAGLDVASTLGTVAGFAESALVFGTGKARVPARSVVPSRPPLARPSVSNPKLKNVVADLYKGTTNPNRVGTGTTADAVRFEVSTGQRVFGKSHLQKAQDSARGLENWLKANPNAPYHDRLVARSLADDLLNALGRAP